MLHNIASQLMSYKVVPLTIFAFPLFLLPTGTHQLVFCIPKSVSFLLYSLFFRFHIEVIS